MARKVSKKEICPKCGTKFAVWQRTCPKCGHWSRARRLAFQKRTREDAALISAEIYRTTGQPPKPARGKRICRHCHAQFTTAWKTCPGCGKPVEKSTVPAWIRKIREEYADEISKIHPKKKP